VIASAIDLILSQGEAINGGPFTAASANDISQNPP
jgi:hypothetical protein